MERGMCVCKSMRKKYMLRCVCGVCEKCVCVEVCVCERVWEEACVLRCVCRV